MDAYHHSFMARDSDNLFHNRGKSSELLLLSSFPVDLRDRLSWHRHRSCR